MSDCYLSTLHPEISVALNSHQRSFFFQQMETIAETINRQNAEKKTLTVLLIFLQHTLTSDAQGTLWNFGNTECKNQTTSLSLYEIVSSR